MKNNHLFICRNVKHGRLKKENVWPTVHVQHVVNLSIAVGDKNSKEYNIQMYFPNEEKKTSF